MVYQRHNDTEQSSVLLPGNARLTCFSSILLLSMQQRILFDKLQSDVRGNNMNDNRSIGQDATRAYSCEVVFGHIVLKQRV